MQRAELRKLNIFIASTLLGLLCSGYELWAYHNSVQRVPYTCYLITEFLTVYLIGLLGFSFVLKKRYSHFKGFLEKIKSLDPSIEKIVNTQKGHFVVVEEVIAYLLKIKCHQAQTLSQAKMRFRDWRKNQMKKLKCRQKKMENEVEHFRDACKNLVVGLKLPLRHILQMSRYIDYHYLDKLHPEIQGRFLVILREAEKSRELIENVSQLLKLKEAEEEKVSLNLQELVLAMRQKLENILNYWKAEIEINEPLPTICSSPLKMEKLFSSLVEYLLFQKGRAAIEPKIQIGYKALKDEMLFYICFSARMLVEVMDSELNSEIDNPKGDGDNDEIQMNDQFLVAKAIVESYGGELWEEEENPAKSTIFFKVPNEEFQDHSLKKVA